MPDMAEEQALRFLQARADEVKEIYPPGVRITICSDGHVFSDLVLVADGIVSKYGQRIEEIIDRLGLSALDTFNLKDVYELPDPQKMRDHLCLHYAEAAEKIQDGKVRQPSRPV